MANKTHVVITIENGAASIVVLQDEAPSMHFGEAEMFHGTASSFEGIFVEEETCIRFVEDAPFCHGHHGVPFPAGPSKPLIF